MKKLIFFVLVLSITVSSCQNSDKSEKPNIIRLEDRVAETKATEEVDPEKVVAKVNGVEILQKDLKRKSLDSAIAEEILFIEAQKLGMDKKIDHKLPQGKKVIAINAMRTLFQTNHFEKINPTQEEIDKHYAEISDRYSYVSLAIVNIRGKEKDAIEVKKQVDKIKDPKKLESLESKYIEKKARVVVNETSSAKYRDYQDFIKKEKGYISDIVETGKNRYDIYIVKDVRDLGSDRVRTQIVHSLISKQKAESFKKYIEELKEKNNVTVEIL